MKIKNGIFKDSLKQCYASRKIKKGLVSVLIGFTVIGGCCVFGNNIVIAEDIVGIKASPVDGIRVINGKEVPINTKAVDVKLLFGDNKDKDSEEKSNKDSNVVKNGSQENRSYKSNNRSNSRKDKASEENNTNNEANNIIPTTYKKHMAYIYGYSDGTFKPNNDITRAEAAAIFARLQNLNMSSMSKPSFSDTESSWYNAVINAVVKAGLMKGFPDGTFRPSDKLTRAAMAQIISNINNGKVKDAPFKDIKGNWAEEAIKKVFDSGIINGYSDGTFRPNSHITRAESVKMINAAYNRKVDASGIEEVKNNGFFINFSDNKLGDWFYYDVVEASNNHKYVRDNNNPDSFEMWKCVLQATDK